MSIEYPCRVCKLEVKNDDKSIQCDLCNKWNNIHCVNVSKKKYEKLKNDPLPWYRSFCENELPFPKMSNNNLKNFLHAENPIFHKISSIKTMSKKPRGMMKRFCKINQVFDDNENATSCNYYNIDELNKLNINRHHSLFILHLNISSLFSHIDDLKIFLSLLTAKVDILCLSESRLSQNNPVTTNLDIPGYAFEHTPTELSAGGTLMYISNDISYVLRNDLQIYSPKGLE